MTKLLISLLLSCTLLVACDSNEQADIERFSRDNLSKTSDLYYSYPMDGQQDVAPVTPLVFEFMQPHRLRLADMRLQQQASNGDWHDSDELVGADFNAINAGKGVIITPKQPLATNTTYRLTATTANILNGNFTFTTRPELQGAVSQRVLSTEFEVASLSPDGVSLPVSDFSSFTLSLTQPVDTRTLIYGETVRLEQNGELVAATLVAKGRLLTLDPRVDLDPTQAVVVRLTATIKSVAGAALREFSRTLTPANTHPRITTVLEVMGADTCANPRHVSPLTGMAINCIPVLAKLIGDTRSAPETVSSQTGNIYSELAYLPSFPREFTLTREKRFGTGG